MIIPEEMVTEAEKVFRMVYDYKEDAKQSNASATEALNNLAGMIDKEHSKASIKRMKKAVRKAWKEWKELNEGDTSGDDASVLVTQLRLKDSE